MKLSLLTLLWASAGIAQYAVASPMRIVVIPNAQELDANIHSSQVGSADDSNVARVHAKPLFLPLPPDSPDAPWNHVTILPVPGPRRRPCQFAKPSFQSKLKLKAMNAFRQAFGLPLIDVHAVPTEWGPLMPVVEDEEGDEGGHHHHRHPHHKHPHHRHGHHQHHKHHRKGFMRRIHRALMSLGPWEGRAVAFVLGCGIGVLLRMAWVMVVVTYRMIRGTRQTTQYIQIVCEDVDAHQVVSPPPQYILEKNEELDAKKPMDQA